MGELAYIAQVKRINMMRVFSVDAFAYIVALHEVKVSVLFVFHVWRKPMRLGSPTCVRHGVL